MANNKFIREKINSLVKNKCIVVLGLIISLFKTATFLVLSILFANLIIGLNLDENPDPEIVNDNAAFYCKFILLCGAGAFVLVIIKKISFGFVNEEMTGTMRQSFFMNII
jgi:hypothetical protein